MEKPSALPLVAPITCGPDNTGEFNTALRQHLPGAHDLIRALMASGMMDGLRGVTLAPAGALPCGVQPILSLEAEHRIANAHNAPRSHK